MAILVSCTHCGAPHRAIASGVRFVCHYCQGLNTLADDSGLEELLVPVWPGRRQVHDAARRKLERLGLHRYQLHVEEPRFLPLWHLVSDGGEELVVPAGMRDHALVAAMRIPAVPAVPADDARGAGLPPRPALEIEQSEAEAAALAAFTEPEAVLARRRLVWIPVVPLRVLTNCGEIDGLFVEGAEQILLEPIPPRARDESLRRGPAILYGIYLLACLLAGLMIHSWPQKLMILAGLMGVAYVLLRLEAKEPALGRSGGRFRA